MDWLTHECEQHIQEAAAIVMDTEGSRYCVFEYELEFLVIVIVDSMVLMPDKWGIFEKQMHEETLSVWS